MLDELKSLERERTLRSLDASEPAAPKRRWPLSVDYDAVHTHPVMVERRAHRIAAATGVSIGDAFAAIAALHVRMSADHRGIEWRESLSRDDVRGIAQASRETPARYCGQALERRVFGAKGKRGVPVKGAVADTRMERAGRTPSPGTIIGGDGEWLHACEAIRHARTRLSLVTSERATNAAHDALVAAETLALSLIAVQIRDSIDANTSMVSIDVSHKSEPVRHAVKRGKAAKHAAVNVSRARTIPRPEPRETTVEPVAPQPTVEPAPQPTRRVRFVTLRG